ncbi:TPA: hypothetical protein N0F65_011599 [Lagenidium giganteum]|uniref:Uncharacterized protein n=1 Tax=Lagenidium giganteum TaxID=4803 RepID=A0AAV2ZBC4_9STRA|nr:TPA: hypothetical protein N0F65_011599 [Lagenidium giganteum]
MLFGLGTTSLFHYLFKPYVIRMWVSNQQDHEKAEVTVETVTLFARLQQQSFPLAAVTRPESLSYPTCSLGTWGIYHPAACLLDCT